jgi:pimeloyl-ACP methyl ester carboxylesterase
MGLIAMIGRRVFLSGSMSLGLSSACLTRGVAQIEGLKDKGDHPFPFGSYEKIGTYDTGRLKKILDDERKDAGFDKFEVTYPEPLNAVHLYRVKYRWSAVPEAIFRKTTASGLVAIPVDVKRDFPVLSYQHGTTFGRDACPSKPENSYETRLMIARFAGNGYVVIAPDYFGKGSSEEPDSYTVRDSTRAACYDMLVASRNLFANHGLIPGKKLFLAGWSQGGWATMTFLQELERKGIEVAGASTASAFNDVFSSIQRWVLGYKPTDAAYIPACFTLNLFAYQNYHGTDGNKLNKLTESAIRPEYHAIASRLYAGQASYAEFASATPASVVDYLRPEFVQSIEWGEGAYFDKLRECESYRWRRKTPLHAVYGDADEACPPAIARLAADYGASIGSAESIAVPAGPKADHRGTFLYAVNHQKEWFDKLLG